MTSRARQAREIWTQQLPDLCGIGSPSWADVWSCSTLSTVTYLSTRGQKFSEGTHEVACTKRRCFIASEPSVWEGSSFRLKIAAAQLPRPVLANSCWFLWQTVGFTGGTKTMARFFPAFAHPPCAASLQIIAALPHNPNASPVLLGELHLVDSSKITNEWNWDRDRLLGISILYSQLVNSHHICTWLFHTISSFPIRTHLSLQSCFCNSLALPLSHPVQPAFPLFLHLTLFPSRSTRATFETMLFWQCSDGNQALWLPSKGKSCPSSKHLALPGTAFISSCAALAVWPFRRSNRKHSSTLNWDCGPSAMKTRAEESCKIGQTTAKSKGVNKFNRHFCEYSRNAVTLHASPYPLFVGQFHQWFQTR